MVRMHLCICGLVTACASGAPPVADPGPAARPPQIAPWGFDLAGMDPTVAPGASFYEYANGHWLAATPLPDDRSSSSIFTMLTDRSDERTRHIIETASGPPGSDGQRIGDYYRAFMDEAAIEARGIAAIQPELDRIAKIRDVRGVVVELAASNRRLEASPIRVIVNQDVRAPERYVAGLRQGGLGLPDRDMYDDGAAGFAAVREAYRRYLAAVFALLGRDDPDRRAAAVYGLEQQLAATQWTAVQSRDPQTTHDRMTIAELARRAPGIDWTLWLDTAGLGGQASIEVMQPPAIAAASRLIASQPVAVWQDYLTVHRVTAAAPYLPRRFVEAHFAMFRTTLRGVRQLRERWRRGVDEVTDAMGDAVGKIYVARYFTAQTKAHAEALVDNLRRAMARRIDRLGWMSPATKARAQQKLAACSAQIGYPATWRDDTALVIDAHDAAGNARRAAEHLYDHEIARLGHPVVHDEWWMTPMTVDAYADSTTVVFPAGILQPPFFDPAADPAINYGGIGAFIGHEISHHFDDRGAQTDATGALRNWWTPEDAARFKAATTRLVAQYDAYCPIPAHDGRPARCVNGALTLSENVADLVGLTIAYDAYKLSLGGGPAPMLDGLSGDQRCFLGWAQIWRARVREQALAGDLTTDPHSPAALRVATVRNLDAWYDAFHPAAGDALYLAPAERVKIW